MAINDQAQHTIDGEYADFLKVDNPNEEWVSLEGWFLTDSVQDSQKWQFPEVCGNWNTVHSNATHLKGEMICRHMQRNDV